MNYELDSEQAGTARRIREPLYREKIKKKKIVAHDQEQSLRFGNQ